MNDPRPLPMTCDKCRVASTCPSKGSSPMKLGRQTALCNLLGGYGRTPVDPLILSAESAARAAADGPCLTIAEVPYVDAGSLTLQYKIEKIFSKPVLHAREVSTEMMDRLYPKSSF